MRNILISESLNSVLRSLIEHGYYQRMLLRIEFSEQKSYFLGKCCLLISLHSDLQDDIASHVPHNHCLLCMEVLGGIICLCDPEKFNGLLAVGCQ